LEVRRFDSWGALCTKIQEDSKTGDANEMLETDVDVCDGVDSEKSSVPDEKKFTPADKENAAVVRKYIDRTNQ
jgi:hypothetical protein